MQLKDYVEEVFGQHCSDKLVRIRIGGDNNQKGGVFETFFTAAKVCDIAANNQNSLSDFIISYQELGFVDDLCVRQESALFKENYQIKNSSGAAASWNSEIEERFRMQIQIDNEYHKYPNNKQILLVSCEKKASENMGKIPSDLREICKSDYFPYDPKSTKLLYQSAKLRKSLEVLCDSSNLSNLDAAFRYVVATLACSDQNRSVEDIIGDAKALSKPNVFGALVREQPVLPDWLHRLCIAFQGLEARVESSRVMIGFNGFEVSLGHTPVEPSAEVLNNFNDVSQVFQFLMSAAKKELEDA